MKPDYDLAATMAMETLIQHDIKAAPIIPFPILKSLPGVLVVSFTEMAYEFHMPRADLVTAFGLQNQDAITIVKNIGDKRRYFVAYNQRLPFYMLQRSLARELGHIVLGHNGTRSEEVRSAEAQTFAYHLLCPRPLLHGLMDHGVRLTVEALGNTTGCYERCLSGMRKTPGTTVPAKLNRQVREQFGDYIREYAQYQSFIESEDESALADFGTYMEGYEE